MIRITLTTLLVLLISFPAISQSFQGNWKGVVKTKYMDLPIIAHFVKEGKVWMGTLDSPEQNSYDKPADTVAVYGDSILFRIERIKVEYRGRLTHKDTIKGIFIQGKKIRNVNLIREGKKVNSSYLGGYKEKELSIYNKKDDVTLSATLTYPKKGRKFPTVILISGSGPQDRNSSLLGQKPFKNIAEKLTRSGYAVLRYDERGVGKSTGNFKTATTEDLSNDVRAIITNLKKERKLDKNKIGMAGHSEGSMVAANIAAKDPEIAFVISMGGPGMKFDTLLLLQYRKIAEAAGANEKDIAKSIALNKSIFESARSDIDSLALSKLIYYHVSDKLLADSLDIGADSLKKLALETAAIYNNQVNNAWWRYVLNIDPLIYWKQVKCPVLVQNGYLDLQVPSNPNAINIQSVLMNAGNGSVVIKGYPNRNHLFQVCKTGALSEYSSGAIMFYGKVQNDMVDWLNYIFAE